MAQSLFNNKSILITGGTGSFGSAFCKHLLDKYLLKRLVIFSRDELKQSEIQSQIKDDRVRFFIGDIRDLSRLERAFHDIDIVIHAAALKQVPAIEYNPFEAVKTNILGSQNIIEAALNQGVQKVLLISTDKAVQPINLYGATKLCAEKLFVNGNAYSGGSSAKFSAVRYGNVIGSRGSVIDIINKDSTKEKVSITHKEMTRFWITLEQSFDLVSFALEHMQGGEIFIPKIPSMKVVDMFEALAPKSKKEIIGIRPGEKIHEMLLAPEEIKNTIDVGPYYIVLPDNGGTFEIETRYRKLLNISKKVPRTFIYSSNNNKRWLTEKSFKEIIFGDDRKHEK